VALIARQVGPGPALKRALAFAPAVAFGLALAPAIGLALAPGVAMAQSLARLHVRSFEMTADKYDVKVGETVHLRITALLGEHIARLDNVTLPDLSGFDLLGDERSCFPESDGGTRCVEQMSISPQQAGDLTIAPATLDAIDARSGKASRFATGNLAIKVEPDSEAWLSSWIAALGGVFWPVLRLIGIVLLAGIALAAVAWAFGRPRPPKTVAVVAPPAPPPFTGAPQIEDFGLLIARLAAEPTRANVVAVRDALRRRIGARPDETFGDLLARGAGGADRDLLAAMSAIERAAFCEQARLSEAVADALRALQR
jgi:hypothetical protein